MTSNTRFIAIVGAAIVILIGILLYQKILRCDAVARIRSCSLRAHVQPWIRSRRRTAVPCVLTSWKP